MACRLNIEFCRRLWRTVFVVLIGLSTLAHSAETDFSKDTLSVFISQQPPYEYVDKQGMAQGIAVAKLRSLFRDTSVRVVFEANALARGVKNLHQGIYDISTAVGPSEAIQNAFFVSQRALYDITLVAMRQRARKGITLLSDLKGNIYGTLSDNAFHYIQQKQFQSLLTEQAYPVASVSLGINLVQENKLDYFVTYYDSKVDLPETITFDVLQSRPVFIIVSKQHPQAKSIMTIVEQQLSYR